MEKILVLLENNKNVLLAQIMSHLFNHSKEVLGVAGVFDLLCHSHLWAVPPCGLTGVLIGY